MTEETCKWAGILPETESGYAVFNDRGFFNLHCPYIAPRELFDKYYNKALFSTPSGEEVEVSHPFHKAYRELIRIDSIPGENLRKAKAAYYALAELLDSWIGRTLATLEETGLARDTIVIYFSDHGEMLGEHGSAWPKALTELRRLRSGKMK